MNEKLSAFLVDLASDPDRMAQFLRNPRALLKNTELSVEQRAAVLSRDARRMATALGAASGNGGNVQNVSIGNVQNVTIGNVQNVTIGNVQNVSNVSGTKKRKKRGSTARKKRG